jgi:small subunit ribosomal protein S21
MPRVTVYNDNFEKAIRKFKKQVSNAGIVQEVRERQEYVKPSTKRQTAKKAAKNRQRKTDREQTIQTRKF